MADRGISRLRYRGTSLKSPERAGGESGCGGGRAVAAKVDLVDSEAAAGLVDRAVEEFGSLHGIVHTASVFDPRPLEQTSIEVLDLHVGVRRRADVHC